jgi:hypothetical protein
MKAPLVVAFWGLLNGALVAVLAGFGAKPTVLAIYGSAAALVEVVAVIVWLTQRRGRTRGTRVLPNGDSVFLFAVGIIIVGLSWIFYWQLAPIALLPFGFALGREISLRRRSV